MFDNVKFLLKDIKILFDVKYYVLIFKNAKENLIKFFKKTKYQLKNLFEVNLDNGLYNFYLENFQEAKIRFFIMNFLWKENSCVQYNLGRVYFFLKNFQKSKKYLNRAIKFSNNNESKTCKFYNNELSIFYKKKINLDEEIFYVPNLLQKEKYEYSLDQSILYSFNRLENLKLLFPVFNHYIWLYKNSENSIKKTENLSFLDIGCGLGELGEILRDEYNTSKIFGIDISKKHCLSLKDYQENLLEQRKIEGGDNFSNSPLYNKIKVFEMHEFLIENIKKSNEENLEHKKDLFFDVIFSLGTFGEFGQIGTILKLCEMNLKDNGLVIFYVYQGQDEQLEFRIFDDYFCYNIEYIEQVVKNNTDFSIEFIDNNIKMNNKDIILVVLKK